MPQHFSPVKIVELKLIKDWQTHTPDQTMVLIKLKVYFLIIN
jgi:hypothetical protein